MREIKWQGRSLALEMVEHEGLFWLLLKDVVAALDGHLQDLGGGIIGFCLTDDRCLPLGADDLWETDQGQFVRLTALAPLGVVAEGMPANKQLLLGDPMPDLVFTRLDGGDFALRDLDDRPTLLFAWASW